MALEDYRSKRDFRQSPEPTGRAGGRVPKAGLRFCVQKHNARNLHFDFRLEHNGVLKSWAVPRGPSLDTAVKRLAIEVEDHPVSYVHFEGVIPAGQYGAGTVLVWDTGTWQPQGDVEEMLRSGHLKFTLMGSRLRGEWLLVRTSMKGKQQQWLLSKRDDEEARPEVDVVALYNSSVLAPSSSANVMPLPEFVAPKLPTLTASPPQGKQWVHELKMDGYRVQAQWRHNGFRLMSRNGHDWTHRYKVIDDEFSKLDWEGTIIDGELTALQDDGRSNFDLMQQRMDSRKELALAYFAFDLLYLRGQDQRDKPLLDRKAALKSLIMSSKGTPLVPRLQYLDHMSSGVNELIVQCQSMGLEGIVSKRLDCGYKSGRVSDWVKTKFRYRESLVVVGYETSGKPASLSSLVVGYFDENLELQFAGRVGTGWNEKAAEQILQRLGTLVTAKSSTAPKLPTPQRGGQRDVKLHWVQPLVVADVAFANWTESRQLRQASLVRFNEDVSPQDITAAQLFAEQGTASDSKTNLSNSSDVNADPQRPARRGKKLTIETVPQSTSVFPGLSNPARMLFPKDQITKADLAAYLYRVNQWILPHLGNRPVSLLRCADGIDGQAFFQRHPGKGFPAQISKLRVESEQEPLLSIDDLSALLAAVQISAVELHPWGCHKDDIEHPDRVIIDLDPDENLAWKTVVEAAFTVRAALQAHRLQSFVKTTGGKGLHVVVPLAPGHTWDEIFAFSKTLAVELSQAHKNTFVDNMSKARRRDRIFLDYHRNRRGSTAVSAYSVRARAGAPVSTPVTWDELSTIHPSEFTLRNVPARLAEIHVDPWRDMAVIDQRLMP